MHIVLHQPEIPQNTGNIGRTCVATNTSLHLIEPLGFRLDEKALRRAGMDYWQQLDVTRYMDYEDFKKQHPDAKIWYATTKAKHSYTDVSFGMDDFIMFGNIRSLNLSNSVAIVLYEALRQNDFKDLERQGELHRLHWKE